MDAMKKLKSKRGFTLAELVIVVAIIAVLAGIAFTFVDPNEISYVEATRNAESIATAAQNRLTALRNAGEIDLLQKMGNAVATVASGDTNAKKGGYRYIFSHKDNEKNSEMSFILPFGSIDTELTKGYYVLGIQSDTGMVGEAFWSDKSFGDPSEFIQKLDKGKQDNNLTNMLKEMDIGYYHGDVDDDEIAFAQLPTPQLNITNYENLELSIYLPIVKEFDALGKKFGLRISLSDEDGKIYKNGFTYDDTAIYRTYNYNGVDAKTTDEVQMGVIQMGVTYRLILDTPMVKEGKLVYTDEYLLDYGLNNNTPPPTAKFETWAKMTPAYIGYDFAPGQKKPNSDAQFKLGDDVMITVTVFCLSDVAIGGDPIDPTYMSRSGTVVFNSWFDTINSDGDTVTIACGRHLQNLGKLTEINSSLKKFLPVVEKNEEGGYSYSNYGRGLAYYYTFKGKDIEEKYQYRSVVKKIKNAKQVKAIDFDSSEWQDPNIEPDPTSDNVKGLIPFEPINLPKGFTYKGNYLPIKHLYVDTTLYAGLFGYAYSESLYDILLVNPRVKSYVPAFIADIYEIGVGALIGTSKDSYEISNCQAYMMPEKNKDGNDEYNKNYRIEGEGYVGGLIGFCEDESIRENSASVYVGNENCTSLYVGGLIGCITGDGNVKRSYGAGNLKGQYVGGLIGVVMEDSNSAGDNFYIEGCYTAGHIEGASVSASGLIGRIDEQGGYNKSALSAHDNYCVVIYGEFDSNSKEYEWKSTVKDFKYEYKYDESGVLTSVELISTETGTITPIYGTFEGDGFMWLNASEAGYYTGSYNGAEMFLGAQFDYDNRNYFIPQKGLETYNNVGSITSTYYKDSTYYEHIKEATNKFRAALNNDKDDSDIKNKVLFSIESFRTTVRYAKQLEALESMKLAYDELLEKLEQETGTYTYNGVSYAYRDGGRGSNPFMYVDKEIKPANVDPLHSSSGSNRTKLTAWQMVNILYNGKYEEGSATKTFNLKVSGKTDEAETNTFINYYDKLKDAYKNLIDGTGDATSNKAIVDRIVGEDDKYTDGYLYKYCLSVLYEVFDESKDYFYHESKDKDGKIISITGVEKDLTEHPGEQLFYYLRDNIVKGKIIYYLRTLNAGEAGLKAKLQEKKQEGLTKVIAAVQQVIDAFNDTNNVWKNSSDMKPYMKMITTLAAETQKALKNLQDMLAGVTTNPPTTTPEAMQDAIDDAYAYYNDLYHIFNADVDVKKNETYNLSSKTIDLLNEKDVYKEDDDGLHGKIGELDVTITYNKTSKTYTMTGGVKNISGTENLLKKLKDARGQIQIMGVELNSGVESVMDRLEYYLKLQTSDEKYSNEKVPELVEASIKDLDAILGSEWGGHDSGHRIYSAFELRTIRQMGYIDGEFEYDYNDVKGYSDHFTNHTYVDLDNDITNNVFPYTENAYTKYYPFIMCTGLAISGGGRATGVLFHYGDWLTDDLWATDPQTGHAYHYTGAFSATLEWIKKEMQIILDLSKPDSGYWNEVGYTIENIEYKENIKDYSDIKNIKSYKVAFTKMGHLKSLIYNIADNAKTQLETLISYVEAYEKNPTEENLENVKNQLPKSQNAYNDLWMIFEHSSGYIDFSSDSNTAIEKLGKTEITISGGLKEDAIKLTTIETDNNAEIDIYLHKITDSDGTYHWQFGYINISSSVGPDQQCSNYGAKNIEDAIDTNGNIITKEHDGSNYGMRVFRDMLGGDNDDKDKYGKKKESVLMYFTIEMLTNLIPTTN